jgi:MinD superfamily P-loop ATPase
MKQLTVLSGKGGTGKTTLTACLAVLANKVVVADCDVDAPDLHMLLHPKILETQQFRGPKVACIDETKCTKCGLCRGVCKFDAITEEFAVDAIACEGCSVCTMACPVAAITLNERVSGSAYISQISQGFMSHALLNPGESNSGKLVTLVRQNAKKIAEKERLDLVIIDGSPGIGCPVIASISGVDAALIVTEPTLSGIHDLKRVLELLKHFNVTPYVCINMYDINIENTEKIESFCQKSGAELVGRIPFNSKITEAMVNGKTIVEYDPKNGVSHEIKKMWKKISELLGVEKNDT